MNGQEVAVIGTPSCASYGPSSVLCTIRGQDNALYATSFENASWSSFQRLEGGIFGSDPSCAGIGSPKVLCGITGLDGGTYLSRFENGGPVEFSTGVNFESLGGIAISAPSCKSIPTPGVDQDFLCAIVGQDNALYVTESPEGWQRLDGLLTTTEPSCTSGSSLTSGDVLCAARGQNSALYVNFRPADLENIPLNWSGFQNLDQDEDTIENEVVVSSSPSCVRIAPQEAL